MAAMLEYDADADAVGAFADLGASSSLLLVTFGGIAMGIGGIPPFEFFRALEGGPPSKRLFLRDHYCSWYHRGVREFAGDIEGVESGLREAIAEIEPAKVAMLGASAGGYAALLFGRLLGVAEVHAFGPQTFLSPDLRQRYGDDRWPRLMAELMRSGCYSSEFGDLDRVFECTPAPDSRLVIHYCPDDNLDAIHAEHLSQHAGVELRTHETGGHTLVKDLRDSGKLVQLIRQLVPDDG
jgi:hypothetical protein